MSLDWLIMLDDFMGVYSIIDSKNGDVLYVGSSKGVMRRMSQHRNNLKAGVHACIDFQEWYDNQDLLDDCMVFKPVEIVNDENILSYREMKWFLKLKPRFYSSKPNDDCSAWVRTEESKKRQSKAVSKRIQTKSFNLDMLTSDGNKVTSESELFREISESFSKGLSCKEVLSLHKIDIGVLKRRASRFHEAGVFGTCVNCGEKSSVTSSFCSKYCQHQNKIISKVTLAKKMREEGMSYPQIGRELGVAHNTVMNWVKKY